METSPKWKCVSSTKKKKKSWSHRNPEVNENAAVKMITETSRRHNPSSLSDSKGGVYKGCFFLTLHPQRVSRMIPATDLWTIIFLRAFFFFFRCIWRTIPTVSSLHDVRVRIVLALHVGVCVFLSVNLLDLHFLDLFYLNSPRGLHNPDLFQAPAPGGAEVTSSFSSSVSSSLPTGQLCVRLTQPPRRIEFSLLNYRRWFVSWRNCYCSQDLCEWWLIAARRPVDAHSRAECLLDAWLFFPFSSSKTLNSFLDHVGYLFFLSLLERKFRMSFEEFDVFVSVFAISNFEHVHHGGRGRGGEGMGGQLVCWLWRRGGWAILRWVVSRLPSRWRRHAGWIASATPSPQEKPRERCASHALWVCSAPACSCARTPLRWDVQAEGLFAHMHGVVMGVGRWRVGLGRGAV